MILESKIVQEHTVNWGALRVYSPGISFSVRASGVTSGAFLGHQFMNMQCSPNSNVVTVTTKLALKMCMYGAGA